MVRKAALVWPHLPLPMQGFFEMDLLGLYFHQREKESQRWTFSFPNIERQFSELHSGLASVKSLDEFSGSDHWGSDREGRQQWFYEYDTQSTCNKSKKRWDCNKMKSFCTKNVTINKMKRQYMEWEKISANYVSNKTFISKTCEELMEHSSKNNLIKLGKD